MPTTIPKNRLTSGTSQFYAFAVPFQTLSRGRSAERDKVPRLSVRPSRLGRRSGDRWCGMLRARLRNAVSPREVKACAAQTARCTDVTTRRKHAIAMIVDFAAPIDSGALLLAGLGVVPLRRSQTRRRIATSANGRSNGSIAERQAARSPPTVADTCFQEARGPEGRATTAAACPLLRCVSPLFELPRATDLRYQARQPSARRIRGRAFLLESELCQQHP